jgi:hypothetical protein
MPQCSGCRCDLPGLETVCSKCLETRYSELDHSKSFLESVLSYISNPLGVTAASESKMPLSGAIFCCCGGVFVCWYAGFAKVGYKYSLFSDAVFSGAFQILLQVAGLSLGMSIFLARKNLKLYWEIAFSGFLAISLCYARWAWHVGVFPDILGAK